MNLRRFLFVLFAGVLCSPFAFAQQTVFSITGSQCTTAISVAGQSTVGIQITGSWSGTLQPEIAQQGQAGQNIQVTPSTSTTPQSTITGNGFYTARVAGGTAFLVCGATVSGGTANVYLNATVAAFGGGSGSGGATSCSGLSDAGPLCNLNQPTDAILYGPAGALSSPTTNGPCVVRFNVTASAAVAPDCALPGISVNAQSGNYTLLYSDRTAYLKFSGGTTATLTLCQITTTCASNFPFVVQNLNSGTLTVTANAADSINGGSTGGSISIFPGQGAFFYQDSSSAPGNWWTLPISAYPYSVELASNYTSADANPDPLPALVLPLPANTARTWAIDCHGVYSQATAATSQVISYIASVAPSNVLATGLVVTNTSAVTSQAQIVTSPGTSNQNIVTATPGTTASTRPWEIHLTVKNPSQAASTIQIQWASTTGGTDVTTVYQGSLCTLNPAVN